MGVSGWVLVVDTWVDVGKVSGGLLVVDTWVDVGKVSGGMLVVDLWLDVGKGGCEGFRLDVSGRYMGRC